jgi:DNA topoisomerase I
LGQRLNKAKAQAPKKPKITKALSDSDDDVPLAAKSKAKKSPQAKKSTSPSLSRKKQVKQEVDSDEDVPLARTKPTKRAKPESDSDDDAPLASKAKKSKIKSESMPSRSNGVKKEVSTPKKAGKKGKVKDEDEDVKPEEEDEEYRWWEAAQHDGTKKWTTLEHNGVLFPPPYEPLPKHVKMKYDGKEVSLPPEAEEVAGFFAALIESDHGKNTVFQQNFFNDWLAVLKEHNAVRVPESNVDERHPKSRDSTNVIFDPCGNTSKPKKRKRRN